MNDDEDAALVNSSSRFWDAFGIKEISGVISFNKKAVCLILVFMLCYFFGYAGRFEYIVVSFMGGLYTLGVCWFVVSVVKYLLLDDSLYEGCVSDDDIVGAVSFKETFFRGVRLYWFIVIFCFLGLLLIMLCDRDGVVNPKSYKRVLIDPLWWQYSPFVVMASSVISSIVNIIRVDKIKYMVRDYYVKSAYKKLMWFYGIILFLLPLVWWKTVYQMWLINLLTW